MLLKDEVTKKTIEPLHFVDVYIKGRLESLNWSPTYFAKKIKVSQGEISKILNKERHGLKADVFYKIYTGFGESCTKATKIVYPHLNLRLNKYIPETRNTFGKFMQEFEENKNSIEEIAAKTGISETRLRNLYFGKGSPEAFELLLIEKAIGAEPGELFERLYGE